MRPFLISKSLNLSRDWLRRSYDPSVLQTSPVPPAAVVAAVAGVAGVAPAVADI